MTAMIDHPTGRTEFKFMVPLRQVNEIITDLGPHTTIDGHCAGRRGYRVRSLYYDTEDLRFFFQKLDGQRSRVKLRLRHYNDAIEPDQPVFLEAKTRERRFINKSRLRLRGRDLLELIGNERRFLADLRCEDDVERECARRTIRFYFECLSLRPAVVVTYTRLALVARLDSRFRVTLDFAVAAVDGTDPTEFCNGLRKTGDNFRSPSAPTDNPLGGTDAAPWSIGVADFGPASGYVAALPADRAVLEVKFDGRLPLWAQQLITRHGLRLRSVSKYAAAVRAADVLSRRGRAFANRWACEPAPHRSVAADGILADRRAADVPARAGVC